MLKYARLIHFIKRHEHYCQSEYLRTTTFENSAEILETEISSFLCAMQGWLIQDGVTVSRDIIKNIKDDMVLTHPTGMVESDVKALVVVRDLGRFINHLKRKMLWTHLFIK